MIRNGLTLLALLTLLTAVVPSALATPADVGRVAIIGASETTGLGASPGRGYADLLEADELGDNVLPLAHNGATARLWNTTYVAELDQLIGWQPVAALVVLGGNDWYYARPTAAYSVDLTYLIWQIRARVPNARVILWHDYPIGAGPDVNACEQWPCVHQASTWAAYGTAMRDAAILNYGGYIDDSVRAPSGQPWSAYHGADKIHLTDAGHQQLHDSIKARLSACC